MVPVIGNTLYSSNSHVLIQGLKASAAIIKCPLKRLEKSVPVFVRQTIDILKEIGNTESEVAQTALKSLAIIVRDKSNAEVKEKDLVYLLELLAPDLEEPGRQASVFAILRAIVARRFIVPEIYDLMERLSEVMVTNQSPQVQELCRSVLLQFLLDYPQGKGRLRTTMSFLAKNAAYTYESGRVSVLELLSAIVSKFEGSLIGDYADLLFVALVMVIANDDSTKCREMAAEVVKSLFSRLDVDHRQLLVSHLRSWAGQSGNPQLIRVAAQVYGIILDALQADATTYLSFIIEDLNTNILRSAEKLTDEDQMDVDAQWQVSYHLLSVLGKVIHIFSDVATQPQKLPWTAVVAHLLFPHAWVRLAAARLLGHLFSMLPVAMQPREGYPTTSPLAGLNLKEIADKHSAQLKSSHLSSALGLQIVKNLFYIGKCFCAARGLNPQPTDDVEDESDGEGESEEGESEHEEIHGHNPLAWLFSKLSFQIRSAYISRRNRAANNVGDLCLNTDRSYRLPLGRKIGMSNQLPSFASSRPWQTIWKLPYCKNSWSIFYHLYTASQRMTLCEMSVWVSTFSPCS
jgi:U3 small nucleolar RNA-associated protein 20